MIGAPHYSTHFLRGRARATRPPTAWQRYEAAKAAWIAVHPDPTPAYYAAAMTRIRKECGVA